MNKSLLKRHFYHLHMIIVCICNRQRLPSFIQIRIRNSRIHESPINWCCLIDFFVLAPWTFWLRSRPQSYFRAV